ncbi:hypothetical protein GUJ93_ZPchr0011g27029 [Zizania palustris]|uniref:Uncharacterized protein n=1 Tax=Zizania palustris TaxID=103762 RepID=A0A8J5WIT1_ZIZPA|nr:hypothetical protein GUJ93_ZPchr0011g27029 [Zizania palustris]
MGGGATERTRVHDHRPPVNHQRQHQDCPMECEMVMGSWQRGNQMVWDSLIQADDAERNNLVSGYVMLINAFQQGSAVVRKCKHWWRSN